MRGRVLIATTLALLALAGSPGSVPAQSTLEQARVAFSSGGRIFTVDASGGDRQQLSGPALPFAGASVDSQPAFSPDGTLIAFVRENADFGSNESQIFVMNRDGSGQRALTPDGGRAFDPQWSPDGTTIVLTRFMEVRETVRSSIVTVPVAGGPETRVLARRLSERFPGFILEPAYVPGSDRISYSFYEYTRDGEIVPSLRTVGLDGSGDRLLREESSSAAWSADGSLVAFSGVQDRNGEQCGSDSCSPNGEVYAMDAAGGNLRRLTRNPGSDEVSDLSADGTRVFFSSDRNFPGGDNGEVYSIGADGSCLTWLTNGSPESGSPDVTPTGMTAPQSCGDGGLQPLTELTVEATTRGADPGFWLGRQTGSMLLSYFDELESSTEIHYYDCARFELKLCGPEILLAQEDVCRQIGLSPLRLPQRYELRGGVLLASGNRAGGRGWSMSAYSGGTEILIYAGRLFSGDRRSLAGDLSLLNGSGNGKALPAPQLPGRLLDQAAQAQELARRGGVAGAAEATGRRPVVIRGLLRLAAAEKRLGPFKSARCS